jgi:hypothetical protein
MCFLLSYFKNAFAQTARVLVDILSNNFMITKAAGILTEPRSVESYRFSLTKLVRLNRLVQRGRALPLQHLSESASIRLGPVHTKPVESGPTIVNSTDSESLIGACRCQWANGLRHELFSPAQTLGSWVPIPLKVWMSVCVYSVFVLACV